MGCTGVPGQERFHYVLSGGCFHRIGDGIGGGVGANVRDTGPFRRQRQLQPLSLQGYCHHCSLWWDKLWLLPLTPREPTCIWEPAIRCGSIPRSLSYRAFMVPVAAVPGYTFSFMVSGRRGTATTAGICTSVGTVGAPERYRTSGQCRPSGGHLRSDGDV